MVDHNELDTTEVTENTRTSKSVETRVEGEESPMERGENGELDQIITEENLNFRNDWMGLCPVGWERIHFWLWADQRQMCRLKKILMFVHICCVTVQLHCMATC